MPGWVRYVLERWDWKEILTTTVIVLSSWLVARIFVKTVNRLGNRWARRTASRLDDYLLDAVRLPVSLLIFMAGIYLALHRYQFPLLYFLDGLIFVLSVFLVVYTLIRMTVAFLRWYSDKVGAETEAEALARELLPIADKFAKLLFIAIGIIVILDHFNIEIRSILVTLGVGTLAIGLALQDTLANMFGGLTILLDRPFRVGDRIELSTGEIGDVQEIGIRSTRVLTPEGNVLIVPNGILVKSMMTNHSFPDGRARIMIDVGVAYGTDTGVAKRLMLEAAGESSQVMRFPPPVAAFKAFGESALNLSLVCYTPDFRNKLMVLDALNSAIQSKFEAGGIEIPYPIRTVRIKEET